MRHLLALASTAALLSCVTTAPRPNPESSAGAKEDPGPEAFHRLLDEIWETALRTHPEFGTWIGDSRHNDRWSDITPEAQRAEVEAKGAYLRRLEGFDPATLPEQDRVTRQVLSRRLQLDLEEARFEPWKMPLEPQFSLHLFPAVAPSLITFGRAKDYDDWIARVRAVPKLFADLEANLRLGMAKRWVPPAYIVQKIAGQASRLAATPADQSPFAMPLAKMPEGISAADRQRIREALLGAIERDLKPAYARLDSFLRTEYAAVARSGDGMWSMPDGEAAYALAVRQMTTTSLSPDEIHQIGLREVARIEAEMLAIARSRGFADLNSFHASLDDDPALRPRSREDLLEHYRRYIAGMTARLPQLFGRLPETPVVVMPTEPYREGAAAAAEYKIPSDDGTRPGVVMINTGGFEKRKLVEVEATAYHEGVPGHHMQLAIAQKLPLHALRRHGSSVAYVEGWALYAERLGKEIGLYADPISDYGRLEAEMLRAIRLVVDTGLHAQRWSRQQVVDYFHAHSGIDEVDIQSETDRYVSNPGQALAYKIGSLKILELRERARRELGAAFDLRAFHDQVLGSGALPLDVLEQQVDRWIAARKRPV